VEAGSLDFEVAIIGHDDLVDGGRIFAHRLVVAQGERLDDGAEDSADEFARWVEASERHFDAGGAVRHRLCGSHGAPLAGAVGPQRFEPRFDFVCYCGIEQIFHACKCTGADDVAT